MFFPWLADSGSPFSLFRWEDPFPPPPWRTAFFFLRGFPTGVLEGWPLFPLKTFFSALRLLSPWCGTVRGTISPPQSAFPFVLDPYPFSPFIGPPLIEADSSKRNAFFLLKVTLDCPLYVLDISLLGLSRRDYPRSWVPTLHPRLVTETFLRMVYPLYYRIPFRTHLPFFRALFFGGAGLLPPHIIS